MGWKKWVHLAFWGFELYQVLGGGGVGAIVSTTLIATVDSLADVALAWQVGFFVGISIVAIVLIRFLVWFFSPAVVRLRNKIAGQESSQRVSQQYDPEESGDFEALANNDRFYPIYTFKKPEQAEYFRERSQWYESQRQNPQQYIEFRLAQVDCQYLGESTPYISLDVVVHNYHTEKVEVSFLEGAELHVEGEAFPSSTAVRLPRPRLDRIWTINPGSSRQFYIEVEVQGVACNSMPFRDLVDIAAKDRTMLNWTLSGTWRGLIYGNNRQVLHSDPLSYRGTPQAFQM